MATMTKKMGAKPKPFGKGMTMAKAMPSKGAKGKAGQIKAKKPAKTPMAKTLT